MPAPLVGAAALAAARLIAKKVATQAVKKTPIKAVAKKPVSKRAAVKPPTTKTVQIKSGGNVKPATAKKTIANNPARVGNAPSPSRVKWDLETAKLTARKGKTVKINSAKK